MSDTKRLKTAKAALTSRADQWVKVSENDKEKAEACTDALEKAGYVAELASMKSNSGLEDKVFNLEKTKLLKLVSQCQQLTKISG